jgi:C1A family cysteine protease
MVDVPASIDWTQLGAVTPVKNQGRCGSCYAFSAVGSLEGVYYIRNKNLISFSEQEIVSCDDKNNGCAGGWPNKALNWIKSNTGITTEAEYPYTSGSTGSTGTCKSTGYFDNPKAAPLGITKVASDVQSMMAAVALNPIVVALDASSAAFQSYKSGLVSSLLV